MKTAFRLIAIAHLLILCSCGIGNFQRQKFTKLKSVQTSIVSENEVVLSFFENPINDDCDLLGLEEEDPKIELIKEAISQGTRIIIHEREGRFQLKEPIYDDFNKRLFGELKKVESDIRFDGALEFEFNGKAEEFEKDGIFIEELTVLDANSPEVEMNSTQDEEGEYIRPTIKERKEWTVVTKEEENKSIEAVRAKKFSLLALLSLILSGTGVLLVFALPGIWPLLVLGICLVGYVVMMFIARFNIIRYKRKMDFKKKRMRPVMRFLHAILGGFSELY